MATLDVRDELYCSVCLCIYKDPVTLQCGHNFCKACITCVLKTQEGSGVFSCPECREEFHERPALLRNITLRNIAERFLSAQPDPEGSGILCTYCDSSVLAVKTCLMCEASLCSKHLKKHRDLPEHVLVEPTSSLENRKCPSHKEVLKYYCTKDSTCICVTCRLDGDHQRHQVESLIKASKKKKQNLRYLLQNMTSSRAKTEKTVQKLHVYLKCIQDKAMGETERVAVLFGDLRTQLDDLEKTALSRISKQEKQVTCSVIDLIQQLEIKMEELVRKMNHIEELCDLTDALTVLQESKRYELFEVGREEHENGEEYLKIVNAIGNLDKTVTVEILHTKLSDLLSSAKKVIYTPCSAYKLDSNTADKSLRLSNNGKEARWIKPEPGSSYVVAPERFQDCPQVLSTQGFSTGEHFWETQMSDCGEWRLGVSYKSIDRKGDSSYLGCNNKSWCLAKSSNRYSVIHDRWEIILSQDISGNRFRVWLDYGAGQVSFYELRNPIRHLHTFTATFTEPLHAAYYVFGTNAGLKITT